MRLTQGVARWVARATGWATGWAVARGGVAGRPGESAVGQRLLSDKVKVPALRVGVLVALQLAGDQLSLLERLLRAPRAEEAAFDPRQARIVGTDSR